MKTTVKLIKTIKKKADKNSNGNLVDNLHLKRAYDSDRIRVKYQRERERHAHTINMWFVITIIVFIVLYVSGRKWGEIVYNNTRRYLPRLPWRLPFKVLPFKQQKIRPPTPTLCVVESDVDCVKKYDLEIKNDQVCTSSTSVSLVYCYFQSLVGMLRRVCDCVYGWLRACDCVAYVSACKQRRKRNKITGRTMCIEKVVFCLILPRLNAK